MRNFLRIAGLIALMAVVPGARAADVSGTWKGAFDFEGTSMPLTFHLTVASGSVTGTVEGLPTTPAEIHDGKVDGDTVTFWLNTNYHGQTFKLVYTGKISAVGDEIAFLFETEEKSWSAQMSAQRSVEMAPTAALAQSAAAMDATGTWKGAFEYNGASVPVVFHLTSAAGVVTGTVEGLPTTPAEIHDGNADGDSVAFWVNTDYQGQTYKLTCKGKIAAGQIVFTIGTEDGSWATQMTATKGA
jgi:hypothetical protein